MSRAYRVRWSHASTTVTAADHCHLELDLLGILSQGDMLDLLRAVLKERGWTEDDDGTVRIQQGKVDVTLAPDGSGLDIRLSDERQVHGRATSQSEAQKQADRAAERSQSELEQDVARQLVAAEPEARAALHEALQEVYVRALKRKAHSMGEVQGIAENTLDDGQIEVVIKVKA
ncbi:MAG: hypothetical protein KTR31_37965 [Myxococcales bacterium]|nr:hypothetical protein [Myxococcales bacterium]